MILHYCINTSEEANLFRKSLHRPSLTMATSWKGITGNSVAARPRHSIKASLTAYQSQYPASLEEEGSSGHSGGQNKAGSDTHGVGLERVRYDDLTATQSQTYHAGLVGGLRDGRDSGVAGGQIRGRRNGVSRLRGRLLGDGRALSGRLGGRRSGLRLRGSLGGGGCGLRSSGLIGSGGGDGIGSRLSLAGGGGSLCFTSVQLVSEERR